MVFRRFKPTRQDSITATLIFRITRPPQKAQSADETPATRQASHAAARLKIECNKQVLHYWLAPKNQKRSQPAMPPKTNRI
jgi:hypothetical protein